MAALQFTHEQRMALSTHGLGREQINKLESSLLLAKALMDAKGPRMADVRDVLNDSRMGFCRALKAAETLLHPKTSAQLEASNRVMMADENDDSAQDGEAIKSAIHALTKAHDVIVNALAELSKEQTRFKTSIRIFQRIDKALLDGFIDDAGIGIEGLPSKPYQYIAPSRYGTYREIIGIYYAAIGHSLDNPDQAIRNYMAWCDRAKLPHI